MMMRLLGEALHRFEEIRRQRKLVTKILVETYQMMITVEDDVEDDKNLLASEQHRVVFPHFCHSLSCTLHVLAVSEQR